MAWQSNTRKRGSYIVFVGGLAAWGFVVALGVDGREPEAGPSSRRSQTALLDALGAAAAATPSTLQPPIHESVDPFPLPPHLVGVDLSRQTREEADMKSHGCRHCHQNVPEMHRQETVRLGCCDCHGGNPNTIDITLAHVQPRFPNAWRTSANPVRSYTLLNQESPEFIRFVNPGDLRIAHISCGTAGCHTNEVLEVRTSMMTHGSMLWGAALYNNGSYPLKHAHFGESYSMNGAPQRLQTVPPPTDDEIRFKGIVPYLDPLPRFEVSQPGNVLRIFERGGRFRPEVGIPERLEEPGRPRSRLSTRGLGTENRTDPVLIGLAKTRLLDPTLNFLGTNDHPGDYRSSGCTSCHVVYANDRSLVHSGPFARFGHMGRSFSADPMIPKDQSGHPIEHRFVLAPPTSQCMVCHIHPGTTVMNSYVGFMWWDEETDGELMYPREQRYPTAEEYSQANMSNPDDAAVQGLWSDPRFLEQVYDMNPYARHTQFADFHGHGWIFRAVYKKDRKGNLLDHRGDVIHDVTTDKLVAAMAAHNEPGALGHHHDGIPVHFMDIHMERGMHCVDCHFKQDMHGNTKLYGEVRAAIEIGCVDCHGSAAARTNLRTSGPAAPPATPENPLGGADLAAKFTPWGEKRFEWRADGVLVQRSMVERERAWEVVQVVDTIDPNNERFYNAKSHLAKTVRFDETDQLTWGSLPVENGAPSDVQCPHSPSKMSCQACHSAWNPSCFGCHLPQKANRKTPTLHFEGDVTRNQVSYNFQTLRDDVFMLARDGTATGNRINPARSSCAVHVGSYNQNRESIYVQQQTISADGLAGIAFSTNVPHTVRGSDGTKQCSDCHVSAANDNNAIMAQLLMQGTNYVNFIGRYCWVAAGEHGLFGVVVTERDEPQAVIGSSLHELAFPDFFEEHLEHERLLEHAHEHPGKDISDNVLHPFRKHEVLQVQARGEYLYAACGEGGLRVFDIAFIDDKAFSERITTAPVSPIGQRFYVKTRYAEAVAAPTTVAPDPTRVQNPSNEEQPIHALYGYLYVADRYEGLILVGAGTLLDGNPLNNFLEREVTFNPNGILCGARAVTIVGNYAYVCADAGLVIVGLDDPKHPYVAAVVGHEYLDHPHCVQVQFRYAFVTDEQGVKIFDVTELDRPEYKATFPIEDAHGIYVARTYAFVAAGKQGLVILDVTNPEAPVLDQIYTADGCLCDVHDVKLGITYTSEFAYLADGEYLRVVQLTSPETPGNGGFSPRMAPRLVASFKIPKGGHALAISEGVDRDRAVDESGNQIGVFGRVGARPFSLDEQRRLYWRNGNVWRVTDDPANYRDGNTYRGPPLWQGPRLPR